MNPVRRAIESIDWQNRRTRVVTFLALMAFGLTLTIAMWAVATRDADAAHDAHREAALGEATGGVQDFVAGVEDVLVDARLFAAENGYDAERFEEYADRLVALNPVINGVSLLDGDGRAVAGAGSRELLADPGRGCLLYTSTRGTWAR